MLNILIAILVMVSDTSANVVVTVQGRIRGYSNDGYVSYNGIPYASIGSNTNRFKQGGLAPFWHDVMESQTSQCTQYSKVEDCLRLDIHVPIADSSPWPVLVWVTGGSGQYYPGKLVQQDIIVVVVHHRLGPAGFLCMNDEKIPGNAGIKDVAAALRWVRDNIIAFRGNPANVVVGGQSFGAAMVEALMLSPISQGLYNGVILQSGTVLSPWSFNYDAEERATTLASEFTSQDDVVSSLLSANIAEIAAKSDTINLPYFPFGICVEKAFKSEETVLAKTPYNLLSAKKVHSVPMMMGYNSDEAYIFAYSLKQAKVVRKVARDVSFILPVELKFINKRELTSVARQVKELYFRSNATLTALLAYFRDAYFINHIHRSARFHASSSHQPVYYYQFSHSGRHGVEPEDGLKKNGAAHSDELAYLFPDDNKQLTGDGSVIQDALVKLWTNFVKHLNPTPGGDPVSWSPASEQDPRMLSIDTELKMMSFPHSKAVQIWDEIYDKYYYGRNIRSS